MVPPIKLWDQGVPNEAALRIMTRNSRMPDSLAGDLDAECSACLMGARRLGELFDRYGRAAVEECFDAIIDKTTETFRRETAGQDPRGHATSGRTTPSTTASTSPACTPSGSRSAPSDHAGRTPRCVIDFTGTSPQAKGPINHAGDYADGVFLKKWLAPILRNLADTPERMAELDVNEGVVPLIEMVFPEKGTLLTPIFPAPTNARTFVILRLLGVLAGVLAKATGGRMPADQETIRYTGVYGVDADGQPYLMSEVLGGGSGGRWYADGEDTIHVVPDSRNIPVEFAEARWPFRVERLALACDSGGPGMFRGGLGYDKHIRMLRDASYMSIADRSILSCWGVNGGLRRPAVPGRDRRARRWRAWWTTTRCRRARRSASAPRAAAAGAPATTATRARWPADVRDGKVSIAGALGDYGVVLDGDRIDERGTAELRANLAPAPPTASSTGAPATPDSPAAPPPRWTTCEMHRAPEPGLP